jgi:hypothetical protein
VNARGSYRGESNMYKYRCFLLDGANGISSTADIECAGDDEAQQIARQMLRDRASNDYAIEVWDGARQIFYQVCDPESKSLL